MSGMFFFETHCIILLSVMATGGQPRVTAVIKPAIQISGCNVNCKPIIRISYCLFSSTRKFWEAYGSMVLPYKCYSVEPVVKISSDNITL